MVRWLGMAEIKPFRALRYDTGQAGPLEDLVAPPYDVIGPAEREQYLARSLYNVVHLTLPDSEEEAGRNLRAWRESGVLATEEPAFWALSQDYVGPDGVARMRTGLVGCRSSTSKAHGSGGSKTVASVTRSPTGGS